MKIHLLHFLIIFGTLLNVVGASCKLYDILKESQTIKVVEVLKNCELTSERGLNQETSFKLSQDNHLVCIYW